MTRASDRHIIARRSIMGDGETIPRWRPMAGASMTLAAARAAYDAGLIEMAQRKDKEADEMVQYAIPRRRRDIRAPWFGRSVEVPPHNARRAA